MVPDGTTSQIPFLQANNNAFTSPAPAGLSHDTDHRQESSLPGLKTFFFSMKQFQILNDLFDFYKNSIGSYSYQHCQDEGSKFKRMKLLP